MDVNRGGTGDESSTEFEVGNANANCLSEFQKNTAQSSPKYAIPSEKKSFFLGRRPAPPRPLYIAVNAIPRAQPILLYPTLAYAEVQPDSRRDETWYMRPGTAGLPRSFSSTGSQKERHSVILADCTPSCHTFLTNF